MPNQLNYLYLRICVTSYTFFWCLLFLTWFYCFGNVKLCCKNKKSLHQSLHSRPRRFTLKGFKQYYFTCKDMSLRYYKSSENTNEEPIEKISLRGCEVTPDVNISQQRYGVKLEVPAPDGMTDYIIRFATVSRLLFSSWLCGSHFVTCYCFPVWETGNSCDSRSDCWSSEPQSDFIGLRSSYLSLL